MAAASSSWPLPELLYDVEGVTLPEGGVEGAPSGGFWPVDAPAVALPALGPPACAAVALPALGPPACAAEAIPSRAVRSTSCFLRDLVERGPVGMPVCVGGEKVDTRWGRVRWC